MQKKQLTEEQVREYLDHATGGAISDRLWALLKDDDRIMPVREGEEPLSELAEYVRRLKQAVSGNDLVPLGREPPKMLREKESQIPGLENSALRSLALSILIAKEASEEPMVKSFREGVLGGQLLAAYEVQSWVRDQQEYVVSAWLTVPIIHDPEGVIKTEIRTSSMENQSGESRWSASPTEGTMDQLPRSRFLEYGIPGETWSTMQPVAAGSVLDRLLTLAERLVAPLIPLLDGTTVSGSMAPYPWTIAQATLFVLTGLAPEVNAVKYRVRESPWLTGATRILLDIDPSTTPDEVAQEYRSVRSKILSKRPRSMTEKHLRLAAFAAERPESETWDEKMRAWNQAYPEPQNPHYNYGPEDRRNFHRDVLDAWARLLYPKFRGLREPDSNRYGKTIWTPPTRPTSLTTEQLAELLAEQDPHITWNVLPRGNREEEL